MINKLLVLTFLLGTSIATNSSDSQIDPELDPELDPEFAPEVDSNSEAFSCKDWFPFKDEKCYKIYTNVVSYSDAENICRKVGAILGVIRSNEEQEVINKQLKNANIVDNIWIGLTRNGSNSFAWNDGSALTYLNWVEGRPLNQPGLDCAVMSVDFIRKPFIRTDWQSYGKWLDVNCAKKSAVLCQNIQPWSITKIQNELMKTRNEHTGELAILKQEVKTLKADTVPIGFIYTQLFGQSDPQSLWPNFQWGEVTESYAGQFFRAAGAGSAGFGEVQEQQTQSLTIWSARSGGHFYHSEPYRVAPAENDRYLFTGTDNGAVEQYFGLKLYHGSEEIRPRNQAIRIWQRTA